MATKIDTIEINRTGRFHWHLGEEIFLCPKAFHFFFPVARTMKQATLTVWDEPVEGSQEFMLLTPEKYSIGYWKAIGGIKDVFPTLRRYITELLDGRSEMTVWVTVE